MMIRIFCFFFLLTPLFAADSGDWPSFRGLNASGVVDGQNLPDQWDGEKDVNIRWKTAIPGLAHSSPIIWGNRLFVTTALTSKDEADFKHGLYGAGDASEDQSSHKFDLYCLDKATGKVLWRQTAHEGVPISKRHIKATYANESPATNGKVVVAFFGSHGLHAYDMEGKSLWHKDVGDLNAGAYNAPTMEWGTASSPIIYKNMAIIQCDNHDESFILAADLETGETLWRTTRDELPSWSSPTVYEGKTRAELITNSPNFIRGYDPANGKELWRLGGSSQITTPTPIFSDELIVVASGRRPEKPIFVLRPGASGEITLKEEETSNAHVVWRKEGVGPYMPTPIIYGKYLYSLNNNGVLDCYELESGKDVYRERIPHVGGGFSASPIGADGKLYLPAEDGQIFVIKAGPEFALLTTNALGERIMATPALSEGVMYIRGERHLYAVSR